MKHKPLNANKQLRYNIATYFINGSCGIPEDERIELLKEWVLDDDKFQTLFIMLFGLVDMAKLNRDRQCREAVLKVEFCLAELKRGWDKRFSEPIPADHQCPQ